MAAGFTPRRIHQPQSHPVPEQTNRVLAFLEQPLQPLLWRRLPAAPAIGPLGQRIERGAYGQLLHQQLRLERSIPLTGFGDDPIGAQHLVVVVELNGRCSREFLGFA
jgi:hypothetical protein